MQQLLAPFDGTERALDSGCGAGALAFALAPFVESVVGVDLSEDLVAAGRELAPANCELIVGDATALPFEYGSFDIAGCMRVLHHARRPELVVSELARVTRPGGRILLIDQLGFVDPVVSAETDRFEQARDPSHTRLLPDQDIRFLLDANDLEVLTNEIAPEQRDLERYLDLVGLTGRSGGGSAGWRPAPSTRSRSAGTSRASAAACTRSRLTRPQTLCQLRGNRTSPTNARDDARDDRLRDRDEPVGKPRDHDLGLVLLDRLHDRLRDLAPGSITKRQHEPALENALLREALASRRSRA